MYYNKILFDAEVLNIITINKIGKINKTFQRSYNYKNIIIRYQISIDVEQKNQNYIIFNKYILK